MKHIVIVGNGITGTTVARKLRKFCQDNITIISSETAYFYSRTALMYIYMGHMNFEDTKPYEDCFWEKNKISLKQDYVTKVMPLDKKITLQNGDIVLYDNLIIATGSKANKFGWPGQYLKQVQSLYSYQDLEKIEETTKGIGEAVIVGGGLIGIEMAEMFISRNIKVTFLVRESNFWDIVLPKEEARLIERHIRDHHVDLRLETELKEILSDENGNVNAVITNNGEKISCQFVGLTVGVSPNIDFLKNSDIETDRGVLVNEYFETNIKDIYAGGDCAQFRNPPNGRRPIEQVWYTGKMHGEYIASNICKTPKAYEPGIWFNSAKFFDIEYQTYGMVPNKLPEDQSTFYYENTKEAKSLRINYKKENNAVTGFNLFGIRGRHSVCEKWISNESKLEHVLENLKAMNFDPEFFESFEKDVISLYNILPNKNNININTKKGLFTNYIKNLLQRGSK